MSKSNVFEFNSKQKGKNKSHVLGQMQAGGAGCESSLIRQPVTTQSKSQNGSSSCSTIIIDNGSYECRAGYAYDSEPSMIFKNVVFRQKGKKDSEPDVCFVGDEIENVETVRNQLKSPFDRNVVTQFDAQEMVFDYIFSNLAVSSKEKVSNQIMLTEPICNPNHCRKHMSELLFECYNVPSVIYANDALPSWFNNTANTSNSGLIISYGYQSTHVVPVLNGQIDSENTRRVGVGGYHLDFFMQKLLQLKYPIHASAITLSKCEEIVQEHTQVAEDFQTGCQRWLNIGFYENMVHKMQLPYSNVPNNFAAVALQGEKQAEKARLVKEKQCLEKLDDKQHILDQLAEISELTGTKLYRRLAELGVDSLGELQCHIKAAQISAEDLKRKLLHKDEYCSGVLTIDWLQEKIDKLDNPSLSEKELAAFDVAEYYQLHIGIEQIRVPELLFQPSMLGIDQAGVSETVNFVLHKYDVETQNTLASNVLLTGGCASIPGMLDRIQRDLQSVRPFKSHICVRKAQAPVLDGWYGCRNWLNSVDQSKVAITRALYDEMGGEYLCIHNLSNRYYPTPVVPL